MTGKQRFNLITTKVIFVPIVVFSELVLKKSGFVCKLQVVDFD
jgi:hypothetical protein